VVFVCTRSTAEQSVLDRSAQPGLAATSSCRHHRSMPPSRSPPPDGRRALRAVDRGGTVAINAIHLDRIPEFSYDLLWLGT
jgi:propanol-preferring alcohol dehydrogenase